MQSWVKAEPRQSIREHLHYDALTGAFTWALSNRARRAGAPAGSARPDGYRKISFCKRSYLAHRLAVFFVHGVWPEEVDHINGVRDDNRICNLRVVSRSQNCENLRQAKSHSKTGFLGVSQNGNRWKSVIVVSGRRVHLGTFPSPELAHSVYLTAKRALHAHSTI